MIRDPSPLAPKHFPLKLKEHPIDDLCCPKKTTWNRFVEKKKKSGEPVEMFDMSTGYPDYWTTNTPKKLITNTKHGHIKKASKPIMTCIHVCFLGVCSSSPLWLGELRYHTSWSDSSKAHKHLGQLFVDTSGTSDQRLNSLSCWRKKGNV